MRFESFENTVQGSVLGARALLAFLLAFRRSSRSCLILAFGYASFMMGTLYYLLHLIILGHGPQVFYVAECSWMASYFFFLSLEILYWEGLHPPFSPFALAAGVVIAGVVMRVQVFGPSPLMSGVLALTFGALAYLCFSALRRCCLGWGRTRLGRGPFAVFGPAKSKHDSGLMRSHFCLKCPCRSFCSLPPSSSVITPGSTFTMLWTSC